MLGSAYASRSDRKSDDAGPLPYGDGSFRPAAVCDRGARADGGGIGGYPIRASLRGTSASAWKACISISRKEWVASLDPLPGGGWQYLMGTDDGTVAIFGSRRHAAREGNVETLWMRYEYRQMQYVAGQQYKSEVVR